MKYLWYIILIMSTCITVHAEESTQEPDYIMEDEVSSQEDFLYKVKKLRVKKLSDLVYLSQFSDVAVIQRRFMPKTDRISFSILSVFTLSSEFFFNPGVSGLITYNFLEEHGVEFSSNFILTFNRRVTRDLASAEIGIRVSELLPIAKSFIGMTYKWIPIYGKIALYNNSILSFDTFFNIGLGLSGIQLGSSGIKSGPSKIKIKTNPLVWEPTFITGIGQIFAINRDFGLRWDLRWHSTYSNGSAQFLNDILFSIGCSFYYPSAGLR